MEGKQVTIQLEKCFTFFDHSFNRVKYFSCISNNVKEESLPSEWTIEDQNGIGQGMQEPNDEQKKSILEGYKHFIQRYLVRDCIESFSLSLDSLFFHLLLVKKKTVPSNTNLNKLHDCLNEDEKKLLKRFEYAGLTGKARSLGKLELLESNFEFKLSDDYRQIINSLKDIRNCLSHHNGIVRDNDGDSNGENKRKFSWAIFRIFAIDAESGEEFDLKVGKHVKEGTKICGQLKLTDNHKTFRIGEQLYFSANETFKIAYSLSLVAQQLLRAVTGKEKDVKK